MKRITTLVLVAALTIGCAVSARADGIDVKVQGQWDFVFGWTKNKPFKESYMRAALDGSKEKVRDNDNFIARHRIRTQVNFITSEYLQAVLLFEIGDIDWGRKGSGGALDTDGVNVETKRAYLDWIIPNTEISVRMGLQGMSLPSALGSPVLEADVAGVSIASPVTGWLDVNLFWVRPFDADYNDGGGRDLSDEVDAFGILLPVNFEGIRFTPWFMYGFIGANSGFYDYLFHYEYENSVTDRARSKAWWLGAHLELSLWEPFVFNLEGVYGQINRADLSGLGHNAATGDPGLQKGPGQPSHIGSRGWYIGATLDYTLDFMTPGIFGWYASGDDKDDYLDDGYLGRLPMLGIDGGSFCATSFGTANYYGIGNGDNWQTVMGTPAGTWGVGIQLADISFIEDLSHTIRLAYYRGTNDSDLIKVVGGENAPRFQSDALYLTDKDYVWEVNFDHTYDIYENLTMAVELGWLRLHSDKDTWKQAGMSGLKENDNAWKAEVNFRYSF